MKFKLFVVALASIAFCIGTTCAVDISSIPVEVVSFEEVVTATSSEELDKLLFPSGMKLPTNYLDILSFLNFGEEAYVSELTKDFLDSNYPLDGRSGYTQAEWRSAQLYVATRIMLESPDRTFKDRDYTAMVDFLDAADDRSLSVSNVELFRGMLVEYSDFLNGSLMSGSASYENSESYNEMLSGDESGIVYTLGMASILDVTADRPVDSYEERTLSVFWETREDYMSAMGLEFSGTADDTQLFSSVEADDELSSQDCSEIDDTVVEEPESIVVGDETVVKEQESVVVEDTVSENQNILQSNSEYLKSFATGITESDAVERERSFRDYLLTVCIVLVAVCAIAYGVVDFIRKRNDPARKYRRW